MGIGWAPTFGALDAGAAQRARMLVPAARADLDLVVTHNRTIERAATALATGEFRSAADRSAGHSEAPRPRGSE